MQTRQSCKFAARRLRRRGVIRQVNPAKLSDRPREIPWSVETAIRKILLARRAFRDWSKYPIGYRAKCLKKFARALMANRHRLALAVTRDTGKALWESEEEASALISKIDITLTESVRDVSDRIVDRGAFCAFRPYGVATVLGPFNFPLHLPHGHIVPALLAGNTVVFKPSDKACRTGIVYASCARAAGFPAGVLNVVQGPAEAGEVLAAHPAVAMVLFTGSYSVGLRLQQLTLHQPGKLLALEMGGKNAAVIFDDADLDLAARECARSAYITSGQRCTSTSRIFVHRPVFDRFCRQFARIASSLQVGDPLDPKTFCGPVISEESARRAEIAIRQARRLGGDPILQGGRFDSATGFFVRLSAHRFDRYPGRSTYTSEELFVPEVGIYPFEEADEAVRLVEDTDYGLALAVFTKRRATFEKFLAETAHGVVNWNVGTTGASGHLPFGGRKKSGNARPAAAFAIRNCAYPVAVRSSS